MFTLHGRYSPAHVVAETERTCKTGELGCVACKQKLAENLNADLAPLRESRDHWARRPDDVWDVLKSGADRARARAQETMVMVRKAMALQ